MSTFVKGRNTNGGSVGITAGSGNTDKVFDLENFDATTVGGAAKDLLGIGGEGYAWVDETANRVAGTTYTNTYGKPIMFRTFCKTVTNTNAITIDGIELGYASDGTTQSSVIEAIIPSGSTYSYSGSASLTNAYELK